MGAIQATARELNPELSVDVAAILDKVLSKAPAERYDTATAFVADLASAAMPAPLEAG